MTKKWSEVQSSEQFKSLSNEQQLQAQKQYFDSVIAPQIPEEKVKAAFSQFTNEYPLNNQAKEETGFWSGALATLEGAANNIVAANPITKAYGSIAGDENTDDNFSGALDYIFDRNPDSEYGRQVEAATDAQQQGISLGFADEIQAGKDTGFGFQGNYAETRGKIRANSNKLKDEFGGTYISNEIGGSLPTLVLPAGAIAKAGVATNRALTTTQQVNNLQKVAAAGVNAAKNSPRLTGLAVAGSEGAIAGAGSSEADIGTSDFNKDVGIGAGLGFVLGGAIEGIGKLVDMLPTETLLQNAPVIGKILNRPKANQDIQAYIDKGISNGDFTPEQIANEFASLEKGLRDGNQLSLADLDQFQSLVGNVNRLVNPSSTNASKVNPQGTNVSILDEVQTRQGGQQQSLEETFAPRVSIGDEVPLKNEQGVNTTVKGTNEINPRDRVSNFGDVEPDDGFGLPNQEAIASRVTGELNKATGSMYQQAYKTNFNRTNLPASIQNSPSFKKAYTAAKESIEDDISRVTPPSDFEILHQSMQNLSDEIEVAKRAGEDNRVRILTNIRSGIRDELELASPKFAEAQRMQSGVRSQLSANNDGASLIKEDESIANVFIDNLAQNNVEAATSGYGRALNQQIEEGARDKLTGKLLNKNQVRAWNRLVDKGQSETLKAVDSGLTTEARLNRTKAIAELGRGRGESITDALDAKLGSNAVAKATVAALIVDPSIQALSYAVKRVGESGAVKETALKRWREVQKELYKTISKADLEKVLSGNVEGLDSGTLQTLANTLKGMTYTQGASAAVNPENSLYN